MRKEIIKIGIIFFVVVGLVLFGLNYIFFNQSGPKSKAAGDTVSFVFDPASVTAGSGQDFTTTIKVKPSTDMLIRGYLLGVNFVNTRVQVKKIEYKLGAVSAGIGDSSDDATKLAEINQRGTIKIQGEIQSANGSLLQSASETDVVAITFTSQTADGSSVSIDAVNSFFYKINTDYTLIQIPGVSTSPQGDLVINGGGLTPTGTTGNVKLNLKLKFQGITGKPADAQNSMTVNAKLLKDGTGNQSVTGSGTFTADANGIWSGTIGFNIPDVTGKYFLLLSGDKSMAKKFCDNAPTETTAGTYHCSDAKITLTVGDNNFDLSKVIILAGDLNQDGIVDSVDFGTVKNLLSKTDTDSNKKADINHDGRVDTQDVSLIITALSFKLGDSF